MANINDVAAAVLDRVGPTTAMKLQKLVYYCHAWHLVWEDRPLVSDRFEAWANGPVAPELYRQHRGQFTVAQWPSGAADDLTMDESSTVDAVVQFYGDKSAQWLSELTHSEDPWRDARQGLPAGVRSNAVITDAAMAEYYGGLTDG